MKKSFTLLTTLSCGYAVEVSVSKQLPKNEVARVSDNDDISRDFAELCDRAGFRFEEHSVVTEDGYVLAVYRIPGLLSEEKDIFETDIFSHKPAVLFQHGIMDSAYAWVMHYSDLAPAFVAARAGYDVWLNNSRGNTYSRKHLRWDPDTDKDKFWNFDW